MKSEKMTRREALEFLGIGAAAAFLPRNASAAPTFPKGAIIRTVLKDMAPEELAGGTTLFHEHMSFAPDFMTRWGAYSRATRAAEAARNGQTARAGGGQAGRGRQGGARRGGAPARPADPVFFMDDMDLMVEEMKDAEKSGVVCIVDGSHPDMGRNLDDLRTLSERSGMAIVAGDGYYTQPFYPPEIHTWSVDQIADSVIERVKTQPIGVLGEIGSWDVITDDERKVFAAIAKVHLATNLSIFTHTGIPAKSAMDQLDILEKGGVKPDRIVIGHVGNLVDKDVKLQTALCKRGAFIGFDRQGGPGDAQQVPMVVALIDAGYKDHLMFSSDLASAAQLVHNGGGGYAKTVTVWVPKLRAAGVKEEVLHQILVDNSRRFLACVPKFPRPA